MFLSTYEDYQRKQALDNKWPQKLRLQLVAVCGLFINIASEIGPSGLTLEWMGGRGIKTLECDFTMHRESYKGRKPKLLL